MRIFIIILLIFYSTLFTNNLEDGFVYLNDIDDSIIVNLNYYSNENFTGQCVEGNHSNTCNNLVLLLKYTSLKKVLDYDYKLFPTVTEALEFKDIKDFLIDDIESYKIIFVDGKYCSHLSSKRIRME